VSEPPFPLRPHIREIPAYRLVAEEAPVKLNQNEAPLDVPDAVKEEVFARLRSRPWHRYAQRAPSRVAELLAEQNDWPVEGVVLGGGSNLLLELVTFGTVASGDRCVLYPTPCFALYNLLSRLAGARVVEVPFGDRFSYESKAWVAAIRRHRPDLIFLCVPNNPTGSFMEREGVRDIVGATDALVVLDEAYREFAREDRRDLLAEFPNLILVRTFSKAYSGAGIRLGYLLARPDLAREIGKLVPPFNVNLLTATCAEVMLERRDLWAARVEDILAERTRVLEALDALPGAEVFPTRANFFLVRTARPAPVLAEALAARGVLVRVLGGDSLDRIVRVNVGTAAENDRFLAALRDELG
jgi:histidinol-phosphate aminotransferase